MRIIFDNRNDRYEIHIDDQESDIIFNTSNIVEVRKAFIDRMTWLFDSSVNEQFYKYR